jgi:hypothetical protein
MILVSSKKQAQGSIYKRYHSKPIYPLIRLTTLAWSTEGVIAGGTEKGDLELYNISNIIQEKEDALLFKTNMMVKALDFISNYLASVGNLNDASTSKTHTHTHKTSYFIFIVLHMGCKPIRHHDTLKIHKNDRHQ